MTDFKKLLSNLALHEVDFILIGGLAAVAHGSARLTQDVDILYSRDRDNLERPGSDRRAGSNSGRIRFAVKQFLKAAKGSRKNNFSELVLRFASDWVAND